jgi:hypothetical protein
MDRTVPVVELTKTFTAEAYDQALESWSWIGIEGKRPFLASLFGDVFLADSTGIWMLGLLDGSLERRWGDRAALLSSFETEDGRDEHLLAGLAFGAHSRGLLLQPNEVYNFEPPPVLGGPIDVDHMVPTDFVVAVNLGGQLHQQVRQYPAGTKISGFRYEPSPSPKVRFWRRRR